MDNEKKDKIIGIFGIGLFFLTLISGKLIVYYNIIIGTRFLTFLIFFIIAIVGLFMARRYLNQLFKDR